MKLSVVLPSLIFLIVCWLSGVGLGIAKTNSIANELNRPYEAIMHQAVDRLKQAGLEVDYPQHLPPIIVCDACLTEHNAFGAYEENMDAIVVPKKLDVTTLGGRATLIHEYGHYVMTKSGIPAEQQEKFALILSNSIYQKFFAAANHE